MQEQAQQDQSPQELDPQDQQAQPDQSQLSIDEQLAAKGKELDAAVKGAGRDKEGEEEAPKPEEPKPEEVKKPDVAPKAHHWASLRKQQQDLVQKQQAWAREKDEALAQVRQWEEIKNRAKDDPFEALRLLGYEDGKEFITRVAETGGQMTPEQKRIYQLEQQAEQFRKMRTEQEEQSKQAEQQRQEQAVLDEYHQNIAQYIKETPEFADSLVQAPETEGAVYQLMDHHYRRTGDIMEIHDAVKQVEQIQEKRISGLLNELVSNKRGLAMFNELATKLNKPAQARQKAPPGITQSISNHTGTGKQKNLTLDEKLAIAAQQLNERFS